MTAATTAAVVALASGGCKNSGDDDGLATVQGTASASPTASSHPDPTAFVACMRQHSVNMPEPVANQEWRPDKPEGVSREQFETAVRACQSYLGENLLGQPPSAEEMEKLRTFAICMREHGIEITDPLPDGNMKINGRLGSMNRTQLEADPQYQSAYNACKDKLPVDDGKKK